MFKALLTQLRRLNIDSFSTLQQARLMMYLQLVKIVVLAAILEGLLLLGDCPKWELILVPLVIAGFVVRGLIRDLRNQRAYFGSATS